ncbi:MAG: RNA polymerase sigma factor [Gemmataceae bacterium]
MPAPRSTRPTKEAIDAWVLATLPRATAFARSLLRDAASADDVVHDCYYRILKKADVYDIPNEGTRILYRAITNACINRAGARRLVSLHALGDEDHGHIDPRAPDPFGELLGRELSERLAEGLARLPLPQRAALELKSLGHSLEEIAAALEITLSNAGVLIHRARQALANHLRAGEGTPR